MAERARVSPGSAAGSWQPARLRGAYQPLSVLLAVPGELMVYEKPLSPERDLVNIHLGRKRRLGGRATTALLPAGGGTLGIHRGERQLTLMAARIRVALRFRRPRVWRRCAR